MIIEQTVEIPIDHQLFINVPLEIPAGKAILTFTSVSGIENNCVQAEELKKKLKTLQGSLSKNSFGGLNGIEYQCKVREEWDN
jgi:hypothetical protein